LRIELSAARHNIGCVCTLASCTNLSPLGTKLTHLLTRVNQPERRDCEQRKADPGAGEREDPAAGGKALEILVGTVGAILDQQPAKVGAANDAAGVVHQKVPRRLNHDQQRRIDGAQKRPATPPE